MAAVAPPSQFNTYSPAPKSGILLNPYPPGWSPRTPQVHSLPLPDSPALRSSAPNTPYMQINGRNVPLPRTESTTSSNSGADGSVSANGGGQNGNHSRTNSMRIRFAPLPDPRKLEEAEYMDSPLANNTLTLPATDDTFLASPTTPGSQYSHVSANSATSTSTSGNPNPFAYNISDDAPENVSDQGIMSTISSATKQKSKRWSKTLFKPLFKATSMTSSGHQSDDGMWRTNSRDSFQSATSNEGGLGLSRRMTTESASRPSSAGNGAAGAPLTRVQSAGMGPGRSRKNQKMLNGRVYGAKSTAAAFQNIRDEEPSFVEWGHGGAGSVKNHSGGAESSKYAGVQSGQRVSIGAISGDHAPNNGGDEDEDDGSGVAWIRKRKRERAEKEAKAREEAARVAREAEAQTTSVNEADKTSTSTVDPVSPQLTDDAQAQQVSVPERKASMTVETVSPRQQGTPVLGALPSNVLVSPSLSGTGPHTPSGVDELHIVQAIKLPAPPHVHGTTHGHSHDGVPSVVASPGSPPIQQDTAVTPVSPSSTSSTDSDSEDDEDDDEREEEESETDEEESAEKEQRKTSVCAGVEKISRHKELEQQ